MRFDPILIVYALPLLLLWGGWIVADRRRTRQDRAVLEDNLQAGLMEPNTLHPVIDPAVCLGSGACVRACPEHDVLAITDGRARLINPLACVGHGACMAACPVGAIKLVFGTATRGVELPRVSPTFETTQAGIYVVGELGGMGLIRNAIEQGRQAIAQIARRTGRLASGGAHGGGPDVLDVVIVGCGPAGIAASLGALEHKLHFRTIEQGTLGGTVAHFPRGKLVMTAPARLPLVGEVRFGEVSKEALLGFWQKVIADSGLEPGFEERVIEVARDGDHFDVRTTRSLYRTRAVLLAIGRRGTPRTLDVPGEDLPKVVYRLTDPEQYAGRRVVVVGGGDSAIEAACELAAQPGCTVTLSYRGRAYARARAKNRERIARLVEAGGIEELLASKVAAIALGSVDIALDGELRTLANDDVIVCAGGILPTRFLHDMGIEVETKFGTV